MRKSTQKLNLFASAAVLVLPNLALAQSEANVSDDDFSTQDVIVITGTSAARTEVDTPLSVSVVDEVSIRKFSYSSQADILTTLPGVKAEGGGGEVATNFQVRGLPSGGQFQFTPLEFDGIPLLSTFGLNSSAFDVYARPDLGVERLEYVTGGVSNLFGPGSVAGIINYISKTGGEEDHGTIQAEWAEDGRFRGDFAASGPLAENTYYAISGYYRHDEGPLVSDLDTEGFQLRGNIKREFADDSGSLTIYGQYIDDSVQFFLPLPLDGTSRERAPGNDGDEVFIVNTAEAAGLSYQTPDGVFQSPIGDGVTTKGGSISAVFDKDLGEGWGLNVKMKYSDYDHQFNLFLDGDGVISAPESLQDFLTNRGFGALADANFTFTESGAAVPDDFLLFANRTLDRVRDVTDFTGEANLTKAFQTGDIDHDFTFGAYFARAEAIDINFITTYLAEFNNAPRLVDLTVLDADGSIGGTAGEQATISFGGLLNPGGRTANNDIGATRIAAYIADQMETDRWVFDIGARLERIEGDISKERNAATVIATNATNPNADLTTITFGTGVFNRVDVSETEWAIAVGALYKATDALNVYANFSRGFFFPELRSVRINALGEPGTYESEIILQAEAGVKYNSGPLEASLAGFYSRLTNRQNVTFVNDGMGGLMDQVTDESTRAFGIEGTAAYAITDNLRISGNLTYTDHEISDSETDPSIVGSELLRKPNLVANSGVFYDDGRFDFALFHNYHGSNFANRANSVELDAYHLVRIDAGYTHSFVNDQKVRIGVGVFNLFDSQGLAEGSPRQANAQSAVGEFFVGRPILPRRITVRATYDF